MENVTNDVVVEGHDDIKDTRSTDCPLDVFTPEELIERLKMYDDCTENVVELIKTIHVNQNKMRRLSKIFCAVSNCNTDEIVELTRDKTRMMRYVSSYLVLSKIKQWIEEGRGFEVVERMYDEVFLIRFRDVDFSIRSMCVEFMCSWIISVPLIFNAPCYLKYIGWALSDKNDSVRRKGIGSLIRLMSKKIDIKTFVARFKSRMIEMALHDRNGGLREEGRNLCMISYLHDMIDKVDVYRILSSIGENDKKDLIEKVVMKILSDGISGGLLSNHDGIHELLSNTSLSICSYIPHEPEDITRFIDFILDFLRRMSYCCESRSLCYIRILSVFSSEVRDIQRYCEILDVVKDNEENVIETLICINNTDVEVFKSQPEVTTRMVESMKEYSIQFRCERVFNQYVHLLKKIEKDFPPLVHSVIDHFRSFSIEFTRCIIKSFDISRDIVNEYPSDIKCYSVLWKMVSGDYEYVNECEFNDVSNADVLCDFLIFFKERCVEFGVMNADVDRAIDQGGCFKIMYVKLSLLLHSYAERIFIDSKSCISLFKLVEEDLLVDYSRLLFKGCDEEMISEFITRSKSKMNWISGYFRYVMESDEEKNGIAKLVASRCNMKRISDEDKIVFRNMRMIVDRKRLRLYDTILIHFIPFLSINECIVIEQGLERSRLKSLLIKRIRGRK